MAEFPNSRVHARHFLRLDSSTLDCPFASKSLIEVLRRLPAALMGLGRLNFLDAGDPLFEQFLNAILQCHLRHWASLAGSL